MSRKTPVSAEAEHLDTSFLLFGKRNFLDVLTGSVIQNMDLDGQLVVLSACDTATGKPLSVEGMDSLAEAFLMAGARCVIASRWPVSDDLPVPLMKEFYRQLYLGRTVEDALWNAKQMLTMGARLAFEDRSSFMAIGFCDFALPVEPTVSIRITEYTKSYWPLLLLLLVFGCLIVRVYRTRKPKL